MKRRYILALLAIIATISTTNAQKLEYIIDFGFNFDNMESSKPYDDSRTLLGVKLAPQIGVSFGKEHRVMVGGDLIQMMGDSIFPSEIDYTIYYRFENKNFGALVGAFPREYSIAEYPLSFFREDYKFYDSNMEGIMLQYKNNKGNGYAELFLDWYGINHELRIDEFLVGASTRYSFYDNLLFTGANMLLNHFKNDYILGDSFLLERAQYNIYVGSDLHHIVPTMDKLSFSFGTNSSMERKRVLDRDTEWKNAMGWQLDIDAEYKGFGLENEFYFGASQFQYHQQYGSNFYMGSPFYQSPIYNRANFYYKWSNKFLSLRADFIFHFTEKTVSNQQMLTLAVNLNSFKR